MSRNTDAVVSDASAVLRTGDDARSAEIRRGDDDLGHLRAGLSGRHRFGRRRRGLGPLFMDESAHDWHLIRLGRTLGRTGVALKTTLRGAGFGCHIEAIRRPLPPPAVGFH